MKFSGRHSGSAPALGSMASIGTISVNVRPALFHLFQHFFPNKWFFRPCGKAGAVNYHDWQLGQRVRQESNLRGCTCRGTSNQRSGVIHIRALNADQESGTRCYTGSERSGSQGGDHDQAAHNADRQRLGRLLALQHHSKCPVSACLRSSFEKARGGSVPLDIIDLIGSRYAQSHPKVVTYGDASAPPQLW